MIYEVGAEQMSKTMNNEIINIEFGFEIGHYANTKAGK